MDNQINIKQIIKEGEKNTVAREEILDFEEMLKNIDGHFEGDTPTCPLEHSFSDGIYVRQISIPAGTLLTGKIHKHDHPNFLLEGEVVVVTDEGQEHLKAPKSMISKAGTKRVLYAITNLVWTTIHHNPTNTRDLEELEKIVIAKNYNEFDKFVLLKAGTFSRLKRNFIKILSK